MKRLNGEPGTGVSGSRTGQTLTPGVADFNVERGPRGPDRGAVATASCLHFRGGIRGAMPHRCQVIGVRSMSHETQEHLDRGRPQIGIRALLISHGIVPLWGIQMPRVENGVIGKSFQCFEAFVHRSRVTPR